MPRLNERVVRTDIARLLSWRESYDHAVSNPNANERAVELARLAASKDDIVTQIALASLAREGPAAADALRPLLDDESLLWEHSKILDTIAVTNAKDIRLAPIIRRENRYWARTCGRKLDPNWLSNYGQPPSYHYDRLVSALRAVHALGISSDLPGVLESGRLIEHCRYLSHQWELLDAINLFRAK